jgi:serine protease Do
MRAWYPPTWLLLAVTIFATHQFSGAQDLPPELLYQKVLPSVMTLRIENKSGEKYVGSAFLAVKENVAVTAWHVIHDAIRVTAKFPDGTTCDVEGYLDKDETKDIALLRVENRGRFPMLPIATMTPLVGSRAYVIGSPKGYEFSISDGLLSQVQKVDGFNQYQVSCPFSPGNSGGPILNGQGEVLGIAAWTRNGAQNLNFATPAQETSSLKTDGPLKRWKNQPGKRVAMFSSDSRKKNSPEEESTETAAELKKVLQKAAGQDITVTIQQNGGSEKFSFTVPSDFLK